MTEDELRRLLRGLPARGPRPQTFRLNDVVRIKSGPLASFTGRIEGINQSKALLKVKVELFGRDRSVKLKFSDVENVSANDSGR